MHFLPLLLQCCMSCSDESDRVIMALHCIYQCHNHHADWAIAGCWGWGWDGGGGRVARVCVCGGHLQQCGWVL